MPGFGDADFFRSILENLHLAVYVIGRDGKILFWNDGAERITGYLRQDVIGHAFSDNFLGENDGNEGNVADAPSPISLVHRDGKSIQAQVSLRHKSGHRIPVQLWAFPIRDAQGVLIGAAEAFEESIPLEETDRRHDKLASYGCIDKASGVLNHSVMHSHLRENLGMFNEHPVPFSVLCIQIDGVEKIQLRDGPAAIASVLRVVGQTLENSLRPTDFLGRWQEHQFLAILAECGENDIDRAADRMRRMVGASKIAWWGDSLPITVSLGGAVVRKGDTIEALVARSEQALRESISQGGNRSTVRSE
jgi:diguanylate cyclase (GGDEF)-like protein/PAS domain S-box-containing protein